MFARGLISVQFMLILLGFACAQEPPEPTANPEQKSKRAKRIDRWTLQVPYETAEDYRQQLANLNAMVAFPEGQKEFRLFRDLDKKVSTVEPPAGLSALNRIYWHNDYPELVQGLAEALGFNGKAKYYYVFFPRDLERALLLAELDAFMQTAPNLPDDSDELEAKVNECRLSTYFTARRAGGKWVVEVVMLELK
jgi:hypothetical protein